MCQGGHASSTMGRVEPGRIFIWYNRCKYLSEVQPRAYTQDFNVQLEQTTPGKYVLTMLKTLILYDPPQAHVYFSPTLDQQKKCSDCEGTLIDGDLFIKYDVIHPQDIGEIQVQYQQNHFL